jgi:hypothetical protein
MGNVKLVILIGFFGFLLWYAGQARAIIESGSLLWISGLIILPLALGYAVGNAEDRAEYHKIIDLILKKLRLR